MSVPIVQSERAARRCSDVTSMRSRAGALGALTVLLSVPLTVLGAILLGISDQITVHVLLATGVYLTAVAAFDFGLPRWFAAAGAALAGGTATIFLLQALAEITQSASLASFAYDVVGQAPEKVLPDLLMVWFAGVLLVACHGRTRVLGWVLLVLAIGYEVARTIPGSTIDRDVAALRAVYLLPFVWFLVESLKRVRPSPRA
jgi:hypothetical protein